MPKQDVILKLNSIGELFNAPDVNPFAANEIDVLGEAALPHAARQMLARRIRHWHEARLIIQLPPGSANALPGGRHPRRVAALLRGQDRE
jgi:hypothetical protein